MQSSGGTSISQVDADKGMCQMEALKLNEASQSQICNDMILYINKTISKNKNELYSNNAV